MLILSIICNFLLVLILAYILCKRRGRAQRRLARAHAAEQAREALQAAIYATRASVFEVLPRSRGDVIFLGDSITSLAPWTELLDSLKVKNRGIFGDRVEYMLTRLDPIIEAAPSKVFIMVGINDLKKNHQLADIVSNYDALLTRLSSGLPDTEVYVQSVLPVNNALYGETKSNAAVVELNRQIKELAARHGMVYIDLFPLFAQADNQLKPEYTSNGLHLSGAGCQVWKSALEPYLQSDSPQRPSANTQPATAARLSVAASD